MHGPTCVCWANLAPFSLQVDATVEKRAEEAKARTLRDAKEAARVEAVMAAAAAAEQHRGEVGPFGIRPPC